MGTKNVKQTSCFCSAISTSTYLKSKTTWLKKGSVTPYKLVKWSKSNAEFNLTLGRLK